MAPPVREQLQAQFDRLAKARQALSAADTDLAALNGEMGRLLLAVESFADAEPFLLHAQTLAPGDTRWPYYLAHVHRLKGESARAAALFEAVLRIRPDDVASLIWLGNVYLDQGRSEAAEPLFVRAVELAPRSAAPHLGLGRAALARRQPGQAIEHLEQVLAIDRGATAAHYPLAAAYRALGKTDRAEAHLRERGDVEPVIPDPLMQELAAVLRSPVAYETRGSRALAAGDFTAAVAHFRQGLALAPDNLAIRQKLAAALSLAGDVPAAVRELDEVLRRAPDFAEAHYSLGVLHLGAGELDQALERFQTAARSDPSYLPARLQLANALRRRERFERALEHYAYLIDRDPRLEEARFGYAVTLVRLGRSEAARRSLADAIRLFPGQPAFVDALARVYATAPDARVRDGQAARALAQQLVSRGATLETAETMAMSLAEVGEFDEAARWQREAIAAATRRRLGGLARAMTDDLRRYERGQPSRTPWREDPAWPPP
jgi:tetratricopeptide (TPR) repeat protein